MTAKTAEAKINLPPFLFEAVEPEVLQAAEYAWDKGLPLLLKGETGTGKTALIRALAHKRKREFRRVNLNGGTTADEFIGRKGLANGNTVWEDGVLTDAARKGHAILVDEINAARPEILFALHSLLDDDRQILLSDNGNEIVKPHPDFRFVAAMNPRDYAGTNEMNKALISRFPVVVDVSFPKPEVELKIVKAHTEFADEEKIKEFIQFANEIRSLYAKEEINFVVSPRELISLCDLLHNGFSMKDALTISLLNKCEKEDKVALQGMVKLQFGFTDTWKQGKTLVERERDVKDAEKDLKDIAKPFGEWVRSWEDFLKQAQSLKSKKTRPTEDELSSLEELKEELRVSAENAVEKIKSFKFAEVPKSKEESK